MKTVPNAVPLPTDPPLHRLQHLLHELTLDLLALLIGGRLAVESKESAEIELGRLQELDLADVNLMSVSNRLLS